MAAERRRRIRVGVEELRSLVPGVDGSKPKMDTADALLAAAHYIRYLQAQILYLHRHRQSQQLQKQVQVQKQKQKQAMAMAMAQAEELLLGSDLPDINNAWLQQEQQQQQQQLLLLERLLGSAAVQERLWRRSLCLATIDVQEPSRRILSLSIAPKPKADQPCERQGGRLLNPKP